MHSRLATFLGALGRFLIGLGLVVLLFAGYQLWGTGLQEGRAQSALEDEFAARQAAFADLQSGPAITAPPTTEPPQGLPSTTVPAQPSSTPATLPIELAPELAEELIPDHGEPLGQIRIPAIGLEKTIVEGVGRDDLRRGPGHYADTPFPGQAGNAAIAGHRTTYGQPFHDLDLLQPGDLIEVETLQGVFHYEVLPQPGPDGDDLGHFIVDPSQVDVVDDQGDNRLTLTACHPKYSARQRIVVSALMVGAPAPTLIVPEDTTDPSTAVDAPAITEADVDDAVDEASTVSGEESLEESLGWHMEELSPTLLWGGLGLLVLFAGWLFGRAWRRWPAYILTAPMFLVVLFVTFGHLDRMLPAF